MPRPIRSGHRGAAGLAEANTLASYDLAITLGCDLVEVDVQQAADGVVVLFHDDHLELDGRQRRIDSLTMDEIRAVALPNGGRIPTLLEALALIGRRAIPLLDIKGVGFERTLAETVQEAGVAKAIVCGRPLASLLAVHAANSDIATSLTLDGRRLSEMDAYRVAAIPTDAVTVNYRRLTPELLKHFHECQITVIAWTVDDVAAMREVIAWGIDGLTTNRPDLLALVAPRA